MSYQIKNRAIKGCDGKWYDADCITRGVEIRRGKKRGTWERVKPPTAAELRLIGAKDRIREARLAVSDAIKTLNQAQKRLSKLQNSPLAIREGI